MRDWFLTKSGKVNGRKIKLLADGQYPNVKDKLDLLVPFSDDISCQVWHVVNDVESVPLCSCGASLTFKNMRLGYGQYCSRKCANQSPDRVSKILATKERVYGKDWKSEIAAKSREAYRAKTGFDHPLLNPEVLDKINQTQTESYGGVGFQSSDIRDTAQQALIDRFGVASGNAVIKPAAAELLESVDIDQLHQTMSLNEIAKEIGVSPSVVRSRLTIDVIKDNTSSWERIIQSFLTELGIDFITNDRKLISPQEIDILIPSHNLAIEVNGMWYHSQRYGMDKHYHLNKTIRAEQAGYRLIHLFESDLLSGDKWKGLLINVLNINQERIYARSTKIVNLSHNQLKSFLDDYHMQGSGSPSKVAYGLTHNDKLVAVMSFGNARFNSKYQWELLRFCIKDNTSVIGGASKLFTHFIRQHNPQSIMSYSDKRLFNGMMYEILGMEHLHDSAPTDWYFHMSDPDYKLFHRMHMQKYKLKEMLPNFDPKLSGWENLIAHNWNRIHDCGQSVWGWEAFNQLPFPNTCC